MCPPGGHVSPWNVSHRLICVSIKISIRTYNFFNYLHFAIRWFYIQGILRIGLECYVEISFKFSFRLMLTHDLLSINSFGNVEWRIMGNFMTECFGMVIIPRTDFSTMGFDKQNSARTQYPHGTEPFVFIRTLINAFAMAFIETNFSAAEPIFWKCGIPVVLRT